MWSTISIAITQLFRAITVLFSAAEKGAKAIDNLAGWSEAASGNFADSASVERQVAKFKLMATARAEALSLGLVLDADLNVQDAVVKKVKPFPAIASASAA